jgi:hypothetical protein
MDTTVKSSSKQKPKKKIKKNANANKKTTPDTNINNNTYSNVNTNSNTNKLMEYFAKQNAIVEKRPEYQSTTTTISGLNYVSANFLVNTISITLGIIIFALIPYVANRVKKPITSAILNVVPNGMMLGYFIVDKSFIKYFTGLIIAPLLNPLLDLFTYYLYMYLKLSAKMSLCIGIGLWASMVLIAYILKI